MESTDILFYFFVISSNWDKNGAVWREINNAREREPSELRKRSKYKKQKCMAISLVLKLLTSVSGLKYVFDLRTFLTQNLCHRKYL